MNALAIGAHPDDLEVFCGGTLARYAQSGARVMMCSVTDGRAHPPGDPDRISALRRAEAQAAADMIGAELFWLGVPDAELVGDLTTLQKFVDLIGRAEPHIIITHASGDYHHDHNLTSRLVTDAVQMAYVQYPATRRSIPVAFMASALGIEFAPEDYVDISTVWETKLNMVLQHRTQFLSGPPYDPDQVQLPLDQYYIVRIARIMSEFYGLACNVPYAEAFRWWRAADRLVPARLLP
jgi:LmbE family N-acetylglucosaminyl deacetylase